MRVVLPLTMPGIFAGSIQTFIPSLGFFFISDMMGGAKKSVPVSKKLASGRCFVHCIDCNYFDFNETLHKSRQPGRYGIRGETGK